MQGPLLSIELQREQDVVLARQRARQIASLLRFDNQDQVRIATAVSEIARNAHMYGRKGKIEFSLGLNPDPRLQILVCDSGPGIPHLQDVLEGVYASRTGMGLGIIGARRLMDSFDITSSPSGVRIAMTRRIPPEFGPLNSQAANRIAAELARLKAEDPFIELQRQNHDLLTALEELQRKRSELAELNRELEDTNRGVVALYAELDEKADHLRRASEIKTRFLSNMTHEFRTPVNSILSLCRLLVDRVDGDLTPDQEKQVKFIQKAAGDLSDLVNDLLDLAKVEAGKVTLRPSSFEVSDLFGALRGMLRPLLGANPQVTLVLEDPVGLPTFKTDESKLSQVLRNFIANALKFTGKGEVLVTAQTTADWEPPADLHVFGSSGSGVPRREDWAIFRVADTGVGIQAANIPLIFEEFTQIEGSHQSHVRGTGLGLPLSRKLAELLGGGVAVRSQPGVGSEFYVFLPIVFSGSIEAVYVVPATPPADVARLATRSGIPSLLIVDDDEVSRYVLRGLLSGLPYPVIECANPLDGLKIAETESVAAIFLDIIMPELDGFAFLQRLKNHPRTAAIPVIVHSSKVFSEQERQQLQQQAFCVLSKDHRDREASLRSIQEALSKAGVRVT